MYKAVKADYFSISSKPVSRPVSGIYMLICSPLVTACCLFNELGLRSLQSCVLYLVLVLLKRIITLCEKWRKWKKEECSCCYLLISGHRTVSQRQWTCAYLILSAFSVLSSLVSKPRSLFPCLTLFVSFSLTPLSHGRAVYFVTSIVDYEENGHNHSLSLTSNRPYISLIPSDVS